MRSQPSGRNGPARTKSSSTARYTTQLRGGGREYARTRVRASDAGQTSGARFGVTRRVALRAAEAAAARRAPSTCC